MEEELVGVSIYLTNADLMAELDTMDVNSAEYKEAAKILAELYALQIKQDHEDNDHELRKAELQYKLDELKVREEANRLKGEEIKEAKKARWFDGVLRVGKFVGIGTLAMGAIGVQYKMHQEDNSLTEKGYIVKDRTRLTNFADKVGGFITKLF